MTAIYVSLRDSGVVIWRNLTNLRRQPDLLLSATLQPIMFVLVFGYVFGGSLGGVDYREFLMGGIFAQTVAFSSAFTTVGIAADLQKGVIDRFRSLPMSRPAVLLGRTSSDLVVSGFGLVITSLCGLLVGWRIRGSVLDALVAYLVLLLFSFAMSWIGALIGMVSGSVEVAQGAGLFWMFPVTFISSAFVSAASLPAPLRAIAEWNPMTAAADSSRELFRNPSPGVLDRGNSWPAHHAPLYAVLCCAAILVVVVPLAVMKYRKVASR